MSGKLGLGGLCILILAFVLLPFGCRHDRADRDASAKRERQSWDDYVNSFIENYFVAHPHFAVSAGRHEFDGKLPDVSPEGITKEIQRLRGEKTRVTKFENARLDKAD